MQRKNPCLCSSRSVSSIGHCWTRNSVVSTRNLLQCYSRCSVVAFAVDCLSASRCWRHGAGDCEFETWYPQLLFCLLFSESHGGHWSAIEMPAAKASWYLPLSVADYLIFWQKSSPCYSFASMCDLWTGHLAALQLSYFCWLRTVLALFHPSEVNDSMNRLNNCYTDIKL